MAQKYDLTLNLPKTDFPMRAGLPKREPDMLKHWEELDIYNEMLKKNEGKPLFNLHDGPPFSNGNIHMGHALNKCIKDFITRSYAMRGYYTPYIPGWDNHGRYGRMSPSGRSSRTAMKPSSVKANMKILLLQI